MAGEFDRIRAIELLQDEGLDNEQVQSELHAWGCVQKTRNKTAASSQLCRWFGEGLIDVIEFQDRLERVGHSSTDAMLILKSCQRGISARELKDAEARARRAIQDREKNQKKTEAAVAKAKRNSESGKRLQAALKKSIEKREDAILSAAETLAKGVASEVRPAIAWVKKEIDRIRKDSGLDYDDSIQAVTLAIESKGDSNVGVSSHDVDEQAAIILAAHNVAAAGESVN